MHGGCNWFAAEPPLRLKGADRQASERPEAGDLDGPEWLWRIESIAGDYWAASFKVAQLVASRIWQRARAIARN